MSLSTSVSCKGRPKFIIIFGAENDIFDGFGQFCIWPKVFFIYLSFSVENQCIFDQVSVI